MRARATADMPTPDPLCQADTASTDGAAGKLEPSTTSPPTEHAQPSTPRGPQHDNSGERAKPAGHTNHDKGAMPQPPPKLPHEE